MAIKNRYEYLSGILEALDVEHTEAEVHNNEVWRSKVLDGMGVEHTYDDINQTDLWRAKVVEGINAMAGGGGSSGEFKIANITWENLPETFEDYDPRSGCMLIKTADGFEDYNDIHAFSEILLCWEDEWVCSPKAIVTTKQPENVGDLAVWLQPYPDTYDFSVVSGDAFIWNRGVILYGDCTLTIA